MSNTSGIVRQRIIECHLRNPGFTAWRISEHCKCDPGYVRRVLGWKPPRRVKECPTPVLDPHTPAAPISADEIWEERRNAEACERLREVLWQHHPRRAA